jgi:hypothetical protein
MIAIRYGLILRHAFFKPAPPTYNCLSFLSRLKTTLA